MVVLVLVAIEAGAGQGAFSVLAIKAGSRSGHQREFAVGLSRQVLGRAIKACAIKEDSRKIVIKAGVVEVDSG